MKKRNKIIVIIIMIALLLPIFIAGITSLTTISSWFNFPLVLFLIGMSMFMFEEIKNLRVNGKMLIAFVVAQYIILAGMMAVPYYAMGSFGALRLTNVL